MKIKVKRVKQSLKIYAIIDFYEVQVIKMRPIAYNKLFYLSNEFTNPKRALWLMRDYMEKAIKLTSETMNKDTILKFKKTRVGFKDVEDMAQCLLNKQKSSDKSRNAKYAIVKDFMKHKYNDAMKSTTSAKKRPDYKQS